MASAHFIAQVCGQPKRLISIHEGGQRRLQIIMHLRGQVSGTDPTQAYMTECKYSLHPSPNSSTGAATAHNTTRFSDGARQDVYLLTQAVRNGSYQPLEHRMFPALQDAPTYTAPPSHEVFDLGSYDPIRHSIYIAIWFAAADMPQPIVRNCSVAAARFKRFSVFALACFTSSRTPEDAPYFQYETTSGTRITRAQIANGTVPGASSGLPFALAEYVAVRDFNAMIQNDRSHIQPLVPASLARSVPTPLFAASPD